MSKFNTIPRNADLIEKMTGEVLPDRDNEEALQDYLETHGPDHPELSRLMGEKVDNPYKDPFEKEDKKEQRASANERYVAPITKRKEGSRWVLSKRKLRVLGAVGGVAAFFVLIFLGLGVKRSQGNDQIAMVEELEAVATEPTGGSDIADLESEAIQELTQLDTIGTESVTQGTQQPGVGLNSGGTSSGVPTYTPEQSQPAQQSASPAPLPPSTLGQGPVFARSARIQTSAKSSWGGLQRSATGDVAGIQTSEGGTRTAHINRSPVENENQSASQTLNPEENAAYNPYEDAAAWSGYNDVSGGGAAEVSPSVASETEQRFLGQSETPQSFPAYGETDPLAAQSSYETGEMLNAQLSIGIITTDDEGTADDATTEVIVSAEDGSVWIGQPILQRTNRLEIFFSSVIKEGKLEPIKAVAVGADGYAGLQASVEMVAPALAADLVRSSAQGVANSIDSLSRSESVTFRGNTPIITSEVVPLAESILGATADAFKPEDSEQRALIRVAKVPQLAALRIIVF